MFAQTVSGCGISRGSGGQKSSSPAQILQELPLLQDAQTSKRATDRRDQEKRVHQVLLLDRSRKEAYLEPYFGGISHLRICLSATPSSVRLAGSDYSWMYMLRCLRNNTQRKLPLAEENTSTNAESKIREVTKQLLSYPTSNNRSGKMVSFPVHRNTLKNITPIRILFY